MDVNPHFESGRYKQNNTFLEDEEYGRALDIFVKGCADVLMQDSETGELLIMRRKVHPQPDWWYVGGRMRAGCSPQESAQKNTKRETGLDLPLDRFKPLCTQSMLWHKRKQEPVHNGTQDITVVHLVRVTPEERAAIKWDQKEYRGMAWVDVQSVIDGDEYHPALRRAAQHTLVQEAYHELENAIAAGLGEAAVSAAASAYVMCQTAAKQMEELPVPFFEEVPLVEA